MDVYFTLHDIRRSFSVIIIDKHVTIYRIETRDKIWEGIVKDIFIGKNYLNEILDLDCNGNTIY